MATDENGPKAAAAPQYTHEELLKGFRLVVGDLKQYYEGRTTAKHVDYPENVVRHRMQVAIATGQILRSMETMLALVKPNAADESAEG